MTREEKLRMLLHPEQYSDEQMDRMLDEEKVCTPDANKEWQRLEAAVANSKIKTQKSKLIRIAAMFVGVLMLSGIAYAAMQILYNYSPDNGQGPQVSESQVSGLQVSESQGSETDSLAMKSVVFEDKELGTILGEVATFYQCEAVYRNEKVKRVRLYFTWDKTKSVDDVVKTFNKFERFHITREDNQLIVE